MRIKCRCKEKNQRCRPTTCCNALESRSCTKVSCSWRCNEGCKNSYASEVTAGLKMIDTMNNTGKGLVCTRDLNKGDFVISFLGELFHIKDWKWKWRQAQYSRNDGRYYTMDLGDSFRVDAYRMGNFASFINHSCDPNCKPQVWVH